MDSIMAFDKTIYHYDSYNRKARCPTCKIVFVKNSPTQKYCDQHKRRK